MNPFAVHKSFNISHRTTFIVANTYVSQLCEHMDAVKSSLATQAKLSHRSWRTPLLQTSPRREYARQGFTDSNLRKPSSKFQNFLKNSWLVH